VNGLSIIILAAGHGKRMFSDLPKVLHCLAGKPLLAYCFETAQQLNPDAIYVVYGSGGDRVRDRFSSAHVHWIEQQQLLGTGHAVAQVLPYIQNDQHRILVLLGDMPLLQAETLQYLLDHTAFDQLGLVTSNFSLPDGYGRVLRDTNYRVKAIVEDKDTSDQQKNINEVNSGVLLANVEMLKVCLQRLENNNAQAEYYLTDVIAYAVQQGLMVNTVMATALEIQGVNDRVQLANLERAYQRYLAKNFLLAGVQILDPDRFDLRGELIAARDVVIDINVLILGKVEIGAGSTIGPNTILKDVVIGSDVNINSFCMIEQALISDHCIIGPFARIRPGTALDQEVQIGNFVEIKNSKIRKRTKINHLSYIGDAVLGENVNVGAGTITCNYDGQQKHETVIADHAFIGSNTALVAPIRIGQGATIGAGSILTRDVDAFSLTLNRAKVRSVKDWSRSRLKKKKKNTEAS